MTRCIRLAATIVVMAFALTYLPGCYTVLKHPQQVSVADDHGQRRTCSDCHDDAYNYHDPYMYRYYDRYSYWDRWYGYYYDPWWYDDYWYYEEGDRRGPALHDGGRTRWGSAPDRAAPPDRGATTTLAPGGAVGKDSGQTQDGTDGAASTSTSKTTDENQRTRWGGDPKRAEPPKTSDTPKKTDDNTEDDKKQSE